MGVFNRIDVQFQEAMHLALTSQNKELADTVAWYRAHFDLLPPELMRAILTDNEFFTKAVTVWDNERFAPKPASEHVALQGSPIELPVLSRKSLRQRKSSYECALIWSLIAVAVVTGLAIWLVAS